MKIETEEFINIMNTREKVIAGSDIHRKMVALFREGFILMMEV